MTATSPVRRLLVACCTSALLVGAGCSLQVQRGVEVEASTAAIADAAARTVGEGGSSFRSVITFDVEPAQRADAAFLNGVEVEVAGRYDEETGRTVAVFDPDSRSGIGAGVVGDLTTITDPASGSLFVQEEPQGPWVRWDLAAVPPQPGGALFGSTRVATLVELVGLSQGPVEPGGQAEVAGADTALLTTSFVPADVVRGEADTAAISAATGLADVAPMLAEPVAVEVYVDGDELVRRVVTTFDTTAALSATGDPVMSAEARVQVDFTAFGRGEPIEVPAEFTEAG